MQVIAPMALTSMMGPAGGMFSSMFPKLGGMFGAMNPMAANALKQSMLGYGTAALSGSRRPGKAAMAAGLTSIPFSYMSAANAANQFNDQYGGMRGMEKYTMTPGQASRMENIAGQPPIHQRYIPKVDPVEGFRKMAESTAQPRITPMDILTGKYKKGINLPPQYMEMDPLETGGTFTNVGGKSYYGDVIPGENIPMDADIFTKRTPLTETLNPKTGNITFAGGESKSDFLPTAVSQAAGLYAGRDTPEEEWEAAKRRRRKELAFMYGIDEDQIEGEMDNPFYGGAFMNTGGLASLNMDDGGGVNGPGSGTSDSIDARLSDGEFVMTAKAVENLGGGDRMAGARKMYSMMNMLDPESEAMNEVV